MELSGQAVMPVKVEVKETDGTWWRLIKSEEPDQAAAIKPTTSWVTSVAAPMVTEYTTAPHESQASGETPQTVLYQYQITSESDIDSSSTTEHVENEPVSSQNRPDSDRTEPMAETKTDLFSGTGSQDMHVPVISLAIKTEPKAELEPDMRGKPRTHTMDFSVIKIGLCHLPVDKEEILNSGVPETVSFQHQIKSEPHIDGNMTEHMDNEPISSQDRSDNDTAEPMAEMKTELPSGAGSQDMCIPDVKLAIKMEPKSVSEPDMRSEQSTEKMMDFSVITTKGLCQLPVDTEETLNSGIPVSSDSSSLSVEKCDSDATEDSQRVLSVDTGAADVASEASDELWKRGTCTSDATEESSVLTLSSTGQSSDKPALPFKCSDCGACFQYQSRFKEHRRKHTKEKPFICDECGVAYAKMNSLKTHQKTHYEWFPCPKCEAAFNRPSRLKFHMRKHKGPKTIPCPQCDTQVAHPSQLKNHMRIHTGERPFSCELCSFSCALASNLKSHMRTHTGERPYCCSICGATFTQSSNLKMHMVVHSDQKPFVCTVCKATFRRAGDLVSHTRIHTGYKPFECMECDAKFRKSSQLIRHVRIHTGEKPFKCRVCCATFQQSGHLKAHIKIHTGEKAFSCPYCSSKFRHSSALEKHKKTHTGERPFKCNECNSAFIRSGELRRHRTAHHLNKVKLFSNVKGSRTTHKKS